MSQVDIYTDIVLRTAAARGELKDFSKAFTSELQRWENTEVSIDVSFRAPDLSAVHQRIRELQQEVVEIPVRFVQHGQAPRPPAASSVQQASSFAAPAAGRFGTNTAGTGGASIAMTNGRPGVDAQGFAGRDAVIAAANQTVDNSPLAKAIDELSGVAKDMRDEFADMARTFESWSQNGGGRRGGGSRDEGFVADDGEAPSVPTTPSGTTARAARRRRERERNAAVENAAMAAELDPSLYTSGYNGGGAAEAAAKPGTRTAGAGKRGEASSYLRSHPSVGKYVGAMGVVAAAEFVLNAGTSIGDAGFGQNANAQYRAKNDARQNVLRSIPIAGRLGGGIYDNMTAISSWFRGEGYVSQHARDEREFHKAEVLDRVSTANYRSGYAAQRARTYDPLEVINQQKRERMQQLGKELEGDDYRIRSIDEARKTGRAMGSLNSAGELRQKGATAEIDAETKRSRDDYNREQGAADKVSDIDRGATARQGAADAKRARLAYGRQEELNNQLAAVDDRVAKKKAEVENTTDPRAKARGELELLEQTEAAKQEKIRITSEAKRRYELEDAEIISSTAEATLRATGNAYDADVEAFEAAWKKKIANEQDSTKRVLLMRQKLAEQAAMEYRLTEQARRNDQATRVSSLNTNGRHLDASKEAAENNFREELIRNGLVDPKTGEAYGRDDPAIKGVKRDLLDSLYRQKAAAVDASKKQYRYSTEDDENEAQERGAAFAGNRFGGQLNSLRKRWERELNEHQDQSAEGERARQAINEKYRVREAELRREHDDNIRHNRITGTQSNLRSQGRGQAAEILGWQQDVAEEIREARGEPDLLKSVIARRAGEARERMMGSQQGQMFGSVADYANSRFMSTLNNDAGAYQMLKDAANALSKAEIGKSR